LYRKDFEKRKTAHRLTAVSMGEQQKEQKKKQK
jgi:hypothetical protein